MTIFHSYVSLPEGREPNCANLQMCCFSCTERGASKIINRMNLKLCAISYKIYTTWPCMTCVWYTVRTANCKKQLDSRSKKKKKNIDMIKLSAITFYFLKKVRYRYRDRIHPHRTGPHAYPCRTFCLKHVLYMFYPYIPYQIFTCTLSHIYTSHAPQARTIPYIDPYRTPCLHAPYPMWIRMVPWP